MIQIQKTIEKFGYNPELLNHGSHKIVIVTCDYCSKEHTKIYKSYIVANKVVHKDACKSCRFKKREDISLKQYGVKNSAQRPEVRKKISDIVSPRLKSEEYKKQIKKIMLEKYGVEHSMQNLEVKNKAKQTMIERYGVEHACQNQEFVDKARQTCLNKYGDIFPSKTEQGKQKIKDGFIKKYGCENAFQNEDVKKKIKQSRIINGSMKIYNNRTMSEISKELGFSHGYFNELVRKYGIEEAVKTQPHISGIEQLVTNWLDSINIQYDIHKKIGNRIYDICILPNKIIIETDGLYWHSDAVIKDKYYHINKRQVYIDNGYTPLFFRENEIENETKFNIVKSIMKNKLHINERIFARKCSVNNVDKHVARDFLNQNHLMGNGSGNSYGLFYNDELVSLIQIRKRNKDGYEISRFCHKIGVGIVGGFSKLLSTISVRPLMTFIDLRYGNGQYLSEFGFNYIHTYPSFKWTNGISTYNRMKFPGTSGYDSGLVRLWDCGQAKWQLI